jgi:tRNA-modifying protein YgfZ
MAATATGDGLVALRADRAFVDLTPWRKVHVTGSEARGWLNDLITADIAPLEPGSSRRSLLLTPTGRIRADFHVGPFEEGFLLVQDLEQPTAIDVLLAPYVLSSDVHLSDRTGELALYACPGREPSDVVPSVALWRPSCLGPGTDVLAEAAPPGTADATAAALTSSGLTEAGLEALEAWRVEQGAPRFGVDLLEDSLPQEGALDHAIGYGKGCFLGQEAVAKVRNLGHAPRVLLPAITGANVGPGDAVLGDGQEAGLVTSATRLPDGRTAAIVRVRWAARTSSLATADGTPIEPIGPAAEQPGPGRPGV